MGTKRESHSGKPHVDWMDDRGKGKKAEDTDLVSLQRALSKIGRRISGSAGTIRLGHRPIVQTRSFFKRKKEKDR